MRPQADSLGQQAPQPRGLTGRETSRCRAPLSHPRLFLGWSTHSGHAGRSRGQEPDIILIHKLERRETRNTPSARLPDDFEEGRLSAHIFVI